MPTLTGLREQIFPAWHSPRIMTSAILSLSLIRAMDSHDSTALSEDGAVYMEMIDSLLTGKGFEELAGKAAEVTGRAITVVVPHLGVEVSSDLGSERLERGRWTSLSVTEMPISSGDRRYGSVLMNGTSDVDQDHFLCALASACLSAIAIEEARREALRSFGGSLIEELLSDQTLREEDIVRRASSVGSDLRSGVTGICVDPIGGEPDRIIRLIIENCEGAIAQLVNDRIYALVPINFDAVADLAEKVSDRGLVAVSSSYTSPSDARTALEEAELMLAIVDEDKAAPVDDIYLDTFRLLFRVLASHPEEMRRFSERTIGALVQHDEQYQTDLIRTLGAYLHEHNCNMNATAKAIFAHRHTVSNRLAKVHELTGLDPFASEDRERLGLALKAQRVVQRRLEL